MTPIKLNNGEEIILVEVPEDSRQYYVTLDGRSVLYKTDNSELEIINLKQPVTGLGIYHKGEIDFEFPKELICSCHYLNEYNDTNICQGCRKIKSVRGFLKSLTSPDKKYVVLIEIKK